MSTAAVTNSHSTCTKLQTLKPAYGTGCHLSCFNLRVHGLVLCELVQDEITRYVFEILLSPSAAP